MLTLIVAVTLLLALPSQAAISRFMGGPAARCSGPGASAYVEPAGLTYAAGALYVADGKGHGLCRLTLDAERLAGTGQQGSAGDGGPAIAAQFNYPVGVVLGPDGTLYVSDSFNHRIRAITGGQVRTLVGTGFDQPFEYPSGLALGPDGALYIADANNNRVVKVALPCTAPCPVEVVAGDGTLAFGGDGGPATLAKLRTPRAVAFDGPDLLIADTENYRIRRVHNGIISTIAGTGSSVYNGDNRAATTATLNKPFGLAVDGGVIYIADTQNNRVRKIEGGTISTAAGTGAMSTGAFSSDPLALAITWPVAVTVGGGALYIGSEVDRVIYRLPLDQATPTVTKVATSTETKSPTRTATLHPSATFTETGTPTSTDTATPTVTRTGTPSATASGAATWTLEPPSTATATAPHTSTPTRSATGTARATASDTPTRTASATATMADTPTAPATITLALATETPAPPILICDVTGNGMVSTIDATRILQAVAGTVTLDERQTVAADATGNGTVSAVDATRVLQYVAGMRPPQLPAARCGELVGG